ncbi:MAG: hypothetical protein CM1200mP41_17200 [Gammaproteobacteria bacterium]|nr:MAG: hypothetical protein CM1200mP41_17200 [Gammaproteobacteria bacterium]
MTHTFSSTVTFWSHCFRVAWIGLLYYFNFVQTEYVKVADEAPSRM